jgi:transcriptional regulator with XRE-family HTH domain
MNTAMKNPAALNYLRTHRKKSGLSQKDLGKLLGYDDPGQVSRHERAVRIPPLRTAIAYEVIFRVPVAVIFAGMSDAIAREVEAKLKRMSASLHNASQIGRNANLNAHKIAWLAERQQAE